MRVPLLSVPYSETSLVSQLWGPPQQQKDEGQDGGKESPQQVKTRQHHIKAQSYHWLRSGREAALASPRLQPPAGCHQRCPLERAEGPPGSSNVAASDDKARCGQTKPPPQGPCLCLFTLKTHLDSEPKMQDKNIEMNGKKLWNLT